MVVFPVLNESTMIKSDSRNKTVASASIPNVSGSPREIETNATVGMVNPILAIAEPSDKLKLFCKWLLRAARNAERPSGNSTTQAMITPESEGGAPAAVSQFFKPGASISANRTTAPKHKNKNTPLQTAEMTP